MSAGEGSTPSADRGTHGTFGGCRRAVSRLDARPMPASLSAALLSAVLLSGPVIGYGTPGPVRAALASTSDGSAPASSEYARAYQLGMEAYTYGLPLLVMNRTFLTMTSVDVSQGAYGPVNRFNNVRSANNAGSTAVVAPGSTSLSSIAWLDLRREPQVLHVPEVTGHYFVLALIDPYTENVRNLGTASHTAPGDYVIAGPGQHQVAIPAGSHRIDVRYSRIWIIGSTQLKGPDDVTTVNAIQDGYTLTPLSKYGTDYEPAAPAHPKTTVTQYPMPAGLRFFDVLGQQLAKFPPPARDAPLLRRLATVGIGPGRTPSKDPKLSSETRRGLADAVAAGPARITSDTEDLFLAGFEAHDGYLLGGFGRYGTGYTLRAVISQVGLGAFVPHQAIYAMSWSDHGTTPLNGSTPYVLHMASPPPTTEGWSLTVYNLKGALIANPIDRYAFTDTSQLTTNADGSIDFYLQSTQPTDPAQAANWLPVAAGQGFEVTWRLFAPQPDRIAGILDGSGWQPPAIEPAD